MSTQISARDGRTMDQIREHYTLEKSLATRLRNSTKEERLHLYAEVYDELFSQLDHHPLVAGKRDTAAREREVADSIRFINRFTTPDSVFLEIGPGDCALSFGMAKHVQRVYAVDVSEEIMNQDDCPENCKMILSGGCDIPVPPETVTFAYSKDLMEHLHPDDAREQLEELFKALAPGGKYNCRTPNGLSGPHDVSRFFDDTPTGLHLKEYTTTELARIFRSVGFSRVTPYVWAKGHLILLPLWPVVAIEWILGFMPRSIRRGVATRLPLKRVLSRVIATK